MKITEQIEWEPDIAPARESSNLRHKMRIEHSRDHKVLLEWSLNNIVEVTYARTIFNQLLSEKYHAFRVYEDGCYAKRMLEFDPQAKDVVLTAEIAWPPPMDYDPTLWKKEEGKLL